MVFSRGARTKKDFFRCKEYIGNAIRTYTKLTYNDGKYPNVNVGIELENISDIEGIAIICNNFMEDMEQGKLLNLE